MPLAAGAVVGRSPVAPNASPSFLLRNRGRADGRRSDLLADNRRRCGPASLDLGLGSERPSTHKRGATAMHTCAPRAACACSSPPLVPPKGNFLRGEGEGECYNVGIDEFERCFFAPQTSRQRARPAVRHASLSSTISRDTADRRRPFFVAVHAAPVRCPVVAKNQGWGNTPIFGRRRRRRMSMPGTQTQIALHRRQLPFLLCWVAFTHQSILLPPSTTLLAEPALHRRCGPLSHAVFFRCPYTSRSPAWGPTNWRPSRPNERYARASADILRPSINAIEPAAPFFGGRLGERAPARPRVVESTPQNPRAARPSSTPYSFAIGDERPKPRHVPRARSGSFRRNGGIPRAPWPSVAFREGRARRAPFPRRLAPRIGKIVDGIEEFCSRRDGRDVRSIDTLSAVRKRRPGLKRKRNPGAIIQSLD